MFERDRQLGHRQVGGKSAFAGSDLLGQSGGMTTTAPSCYAGYRFPAEIIVSV